MTIECHLYVMSCHATFMYSYVIHMSLVCTRMSSVCHSYVLVCLLYVTRKYSYVIRMSFIYPLVCTCMSSVCHSYVVYHEPSSFNTTLNVHNLSLIFILTFCQYQHKEEIQSLRKLIFYKYWHSLIRKVQFRGVFRILSNI